MKIKIMKKNIKNIGILVALILVIIISGLFLLKNLPTTKQPVIKEVAVTPTPTATITMLEFNKLFTINVGNKILIGEQGGSNIGVTMDSMDTTQSTAHLTTVYCPVDSCKSTVKPAKIALSLNSPQIVGNYNYVLTSFTTTSATIYVRKVDMSKLLKNKN